MVEIAREAYRHGPRDPLTSATPSATEACEFSRALDTVCFSLLIGKMTIYSSQPFVDSIGRDIPRNCCIFAEDASIPYAYVSMDADLYVDACIFWTFVDGQLAFRFPHV